MVDANNSSQALDSTGDTSNSFAGEVQGSAPARTSLRPPVPPAIMRQYLKVDDHYLFPDRTVAFIDKGHRIRVRTENREVVRSVVAIAQQRGWQVIKVRGSLAFRQGIWHEAALHRIRVEGYTPTDGDRHQIARAQDRQQQAAKRGQDTLHDQLEPHAPESRAPDSRPAPADLDSDDRRKATGAPRGDRVSPRAPIVGALVAAAAAPYKFDPGQRISFYVTLRTETGDRTIWGADLERALIESASQPSVGETIVLTPQGSEAVNVPVPQRNEAGDLIGDKKIVAKRTRWHIETVEHMRELRHASDLVRSGTWPQQSALDAYPNLAMVAAGMKLAQEYAQRVAPDLQSRQRLVNAIRERLAVAVEQGQAIHLPDDRPRALPARAPHRQRGGRARDGQCHERA